MEAVTTAVNKVKHMVQVNVAPRLIKDIGPTAFASQLRDAAATVDGLRASGAASKVVVVVDGAGASECGSNSLKALGQLFSMEDCDLLDKVSTILIINADETLKSAWAVAKHMDPAKKYAALVRVLD